MNREFLLFLYETNLQYHALMLSDIGYINI